MRRHREPRPRLQHCPCNVLGKGFDFGRLPALARTHPQALAAELRALGTEVEFIRADDGAYTAQ